MVLWIVFVVVNIEGDYIYRFYLTGMPVIGHEKFPFQSIISVELQLQHVWVVSHAAPLDVYWGLLLTTTCGVLGWPVHLVQGSLYVKKTEPPVRSPMMSGELRVAPWNCMCPC